MHFGIYLIIGAFSGTLAGLLGLGGGIVVVPALATLFVYYNVIPESQVMHMAIGTSLATIVITFISTILSHSKRGSIRWDYVKLMLPWLLLGALIGSVLTKYLSTHLLKLLFSVFLFLIAAKLLFTKEVIEGRNPPHQFFTALVSIVTGALSGILGIGGGSLLIPYLLRCNLDMRQAAGTSVATGLIVSIVASITFMWIGWGAVNLPWSTGYVYWPAFLGISVTSILFAPIGTHIAYKLPVKWLRRMLAVCLILIGINML